MSLFLGLASCSDSPVEAESGTTSASPENSEVSTSSIASSSSTGAWESSVGEETFADTNVSLHDLDVSTLSFQGLGHYEQPGPLDLPDVAGLYADVFDMDAAEVEVRRAEVVQYFSTHFGTDVDDPENQGRLFLAPFEVPSEVNYEIGAVNEHRLGQPMRVHDFGWVLVVLDPDGFALGGDFAGEVAQPGALVSAGDYGIDNGEEVVRISFQGTRPFQYTPTGGIDFECALASDVLGTGLSRGTQEFVVLDSGDSGLHIRAQAVFDS